MENSRNKYIQNIFSFKNPHQNEPKLVFHDDHQFRNEHVYKFIHISLPVIQKIKYMIYIEIIISLFKSTGRKKCKHEDFIRILIPETVDDTFSLFKFT